MTESQAGISSEEAARAFEASVADLVEFVRTCSEDDWARLVPVEERTVAGMVALIQQNAPAVAAAMRAVTPEWMDSIVKFAPAGGREFPVARMVALNEVHVSKHLAAVRATIADPA